MLHPSIGESRDSAVSPVIGVILLVAVTVILSTTVALFVFNLGESVDNTSTQDLGVQTTTDGGTVSATVITGTADEVQLLVNGTVEDSEPDAGPGTTLSAAATADSDVTVVSVTDGERSVVSSTNPMATRVSNPETIAGPTDGLLAYYEFDEGTGDEAADTANENHGAITGATWTEGRVGDHALQFSGSGENVEASHQDYLNLSEFTVSTWVNFDALSTGEWQSIVCKGSCGSPDRNYGLFQKKDGKQVHFSFYRTSGDWASYNSNAELSTDTWYHLVMTYDGSEFALYIDGSLDKSVSETGTPTTNSDPLYIGDFPDYSGMNGQVDDVRVYNRALTEDEVQDLYDATK